MWGLGETGARPLGCLCYWFSQQHQSESTCLLQEAEGTLQAAKAISVHRRSRFRYKAESRGQPPERERRWLGVSTQPLRRCQHVLRGWDAAAG